jgi:hypothetical protein
MREQWRAIPDWEGIYEASTYGRVRSLDRTVTVRYRSGREDQRRVAGKILTPTTKSNGYQLVQLYEGGAKTWAHVQHLVLRAFVGDAPPGCEAGHRNGIPDDNRLSNLRYCTHSEIKRASVRRHRQQQEAA